MNESSKVKLYWLDFLNVSIFTLFTNLKENLFDKASKKWTLIQSNFEKI
jgi:hypothetical protein